MQQADGKIRLHGHKVAVLQAQNDIKDIISAAVQQRQKEEAEEMIARMVQWSYIEVCLFEKICNVKVVCMVVTEILANSPFFSAWGNRFRCLLLFEALSLL